MPAPRRILIVDDDANTRLVFRDLIERAGGFAVREAADGQHALEEARAWQPDLILLDVMMPAQTGYEVCAELRRDPQTREVPIIVISAAHESEALPQALAAGADDFLTKPCSMVELRGKICNVARLDRFGSLRRERARFRWLVERSLEPLLVAAADGTLVYANARAQTVFGLTEPQGGDVLALIERHFVCEPSDAFAGLRARGFRPGPSFAILQPESELTAARWFDVELQAGDGDAGELLLKLTDRTGWVRRELETWSFQHMIFHKVRTPLNGLGNVLDLVADAPAVRGDPDTSSLLDMARENARRLEDTLLGVLQFHETLFRRPGAARPAAPVALTELLARSIEAAGLEQPADGCGPVVRTRLAAPLERVFTEVADNYARFSAARERGLRVTIARAPDGGAEVEFFAPGPLPAPEAIAQLGRPYWQLEARFTGEIPGMGLGLATARLLLRSHGGDLQVRAHADATGLITMVRLPASAVEANTETERESTAA